MNKVMLIGHLGADPEIRYTQEGAAVANLRVATNEQWKDKKSGETQKRTEWHRVVLFGRQAEIANEYLKKGHKLYIEGRLQTRKWQDKAGQDRYTTEVVGTGEMEMLGGSGNNRGSQTSSGNGGGATQHQQSSNRQSAPPPNQYVPTTGVLDDDIPF